MDIGMEYWKGMKILVEKVEKLEDKIEEIKYYFEQQDLQNKINAEICNRLEKLELYMAIEDRITASDILCRLNELEKFDELQSRDNKLSKPYKCPVCEGTGIASMRCEIKGLPITPEYCHGCKGKGIIWG